MSLIFRLISTKTTPKAQSLVTTIHLATTMPLSNGAPPHLLTLPGEIRNMIWDYCLNNHVEFLHENGECRKPRLQARPNTAKPWQHQGRLLWLPKVMAWAANLFGLPGSWCSSPLPELNCADLDVWRPSGQSLLPNPHVGLLLACKSIHGEVRNLRFSTTLAFCSPDCAWEPVARMRRTCVDMTSHDKSHDGPEFILRIEDSVQRRVEETQPVNEVFDEVALITARTLLRLDVLIAKNLSIKLEVGRIRQSFH